LSHVVSIQTQVRDATAVAAACSRLNLPAPHEGDFQLFSGSKSGLGVQLPGWRYPIVVDLPSGQLHYDNFEGRWGAQCELDRLMQAYAAEKAALEARRQGHAVTEQLLDDGSIKLTVHVGGSV